MTVFPRQLMLLIFGKILFIGRSQRLRGTSRTLLPLMRCVRAMMVGSVKWVTLTKFLQSVIPFRIGVAVNIPLVLFWLRRTWRRWFHPSRMRLRKMLTRSILIQFRRFYVSQYYVVNRRWYYVHPGGGGGSSRSVLNLFGVRYINSRMGTGGRH